MADINVQKNIYRAPQEFVLRFAWVDGQCLENTLRESFPNHPPPPHSPPELAALRLILPLANCRRFRHEAAN